MSDLKFGTSGLRGLVTELTDAVCAAYADAFLQHMRTGHGVAADATVLVGYDLRDSSPRIAAACMGAARAAGMTVENCGPLPTPALALRALGLGVPAIMVTGSHIPADRNGLKFYRPDGEIDKQDEAAILLALDMAGDRRSLASASGVDRAALAAYARRCEGVLPAGTLAGRRIGVYQHSSVARDLVAEVLSAAGAEVVPLGRSDAFVPVDTEALRPEDVAFAADAAAAHRLDALVSTDGDADRPLVADERGVFLRGDTVGLLTARFLGADAVATPVTSNTAIETSGFFAGVYRTRVGSPYVIDGMRAAARDGHARIVGFEANGGVLLGSDIGRDGRTLTALPTRDAMLPILAVLGLAAQNGSSVSALSALVPARFTASGRLEHVPASASGQFLSGLLDTAVRDAFFVPLGPIAGHDAIDGVRVLLAGGDLVHFRASGNAPELRCYAEAGTAPRAAELRDWGLARAAGAIGAEVPA